MNLRDIFRIFANRKGDQPLEVTRRKKFITVTLSVYETPDKQIHVDNLDVKYSDFKPKVLTRDRKNESDIVKRYLTKGSGYLL